MKQLLQVVLRMQGIPGEEHLVLMCSALRDVRLGVDQVPPGRCFIVAEAECWVLRAQPFQLVDGPIVPKDRDRGPYHSLALRGTVDVMAPRQNSEGYQINLDDGTEAIVRPISPTDAGALLRFHDLLSARSIQLRYFSPHGVLSSDEVTYFTQVDGKSRVALVVECAGDLIAVGRYDRLDDESVAEVAFVVADGYQHRGLATILLQQLADRARSVGITRLVAEVMAENGAMLSVFHDAGFPVEAKSEWGTVRLTMTIAQL